MAYKFDLLALNLHKSLEGVFTLMAVGGSEAKRGINYQALLGVQKMSYKNVLQKVNVLQKWLQKGKHPPL